MSDQPTRRRLLRGVPNLPQEMTMPLGIPEKAQDSHIAMLGKTGSGKSNTAKVVAGLAGQAQPPQILLTTGLGAPAEQPTPQ